MLATRADGRQTVEELKDGPAMDAKDTSTMLASLRAQVTHQPCRARLDHQCPALDGGCVGLSAWLSGVAASPRNAFPTSWNSFFFSFFFFPRFCNSSLLMPRLQLSVYARRRSSAESFTLASRGRD